jgi:hypothetical protein
VVELLGTVVSLALAGLIATASPALAGDACANFAAAYASAARSVAGALFITGPETKPVWRDVEQPEGARYLATTVTSALQDALLSADPNHPQLGRGDLRYDLGLSNPDNIYYLARIQPGADYRIVGRRGTSADLTVQALIGYPATGSLGVNAGLIRLGEIAVDADGRFEILVSSRPQPGNWLNVHPDADTIAIRETFQDWATERAGSFRIERVGAPYGELRPSRTQLIAALDEAAVLLRTESDFYVRVVEGFLGLIPRGPDNPAPAALPPNVLTPPVETSNGLPGQRSSIIQFALEPGEAVLVTASKSRFPYQGFQAGNVWFESFEWARHQTSLTTAQALPDADGLYRFVVSPTDPGVPNWIDTRGQLRGFAFMRWQGLDEDIPPQEFPSARIVELAELRAQLPPETPVVDASARQLALSRREAQAARRLGVTSVPVSVLADRLRALRAADPDCSLAGFLPANITQSGTRAY